MLFLFNFSSLLKQSLLIVELCYGANWATFKQAQTQNNMSRKIILVFQEMEFSSPQKT